MVQVLIFNDGAGDDIYHLLPLLWWQSGHTHLGIPTAQFHLSALQHIYFGPLQFGRFWLLLLFNAFQYKTQK